MRKGLMVFRTLTLVSSLLLTAPTFAQKQAVSTRQAMDLEIKNQAQDLEVYQYKKTKKSKKPKAVKIYSQPKLKKASQFSNDIQYASLDIDAPKTKSAAGQTTRTNPRSGSELAAPPAVLTADVESPKVAPSKFSGSVGLTIGHDSDYHLDRDAGDASFFEIAPSLKYDSKNFEASAGARVKDFSDQMASDQAKETETTVGLAGKFDIGAISSTTRLNIANMDSRWPDWFLNSPNGMPVKYIEAKIAETLSFKKDSLSISTTGSFANRNYTSAFSDTWNPDHIKGNRVYNRDYNEAKLDANIGVKFNDYIAVAGRPALKHKKYKDELARQTNGYKGSESMEATTPMAESLVAEMNLDLPLTLGAFTITPTATVGEEADRALGANDSSFNGGALALQIDIDKDTGLKITSSVSYKTIKYDNWTQDVTDGALRKDSEIGTGIGAAVNVTKAVGLAINYTTFREKSNIPSLDENYNQKIVSSSINIAF